MMDRDQPLPQSDEILMCTSNTTKDEVRNYQNIATDYNFIKMKIIKLEN